MFSEVYHQEAIDQKVVRLRAVHQQAHGQCQNLSSTEQDIASQGKGSLAKEGGANLLAEICLIQSAVKGDLLAFNYLVAMYQDSLYGWVFSLVKDEATADDITQSTFITAYEKLNAFRGGSFRTWLFTIGRNRSYDELRRKKRHPLLSLDDSPEDDLERLAIFPDSAPIPEDVLVATEQAVIIEQLINRLPDVLQQVVRLIDMEGLDYQEAADVLGLPLGTVKSRLARARLKMRFFFQETRRL